MASIAGWFLLRQSIFTKEVHSIGHLVDEQLVHLLSLFDHSKDEQRRKWSWRVLFNNWNALFHWSQYHDHCSTSPLSLVHWKLRLRLLPAFSHWSLMIPVYFERYPSLHKVHHWLDCNPLQREKKVMSDGGAGKIRKVKEGEKQWTITRSDDESWKWHRGI